MLESTKTRVIATYYEQIVELMKAYPDEKERKKIINKLSVTNRIVRTDIDKIIEISCEALRGEDNLRTRRSLPESIINAVYGRSWEDWKRAQDDLD